MSTCVTIFTPKASPFATKATPFAQKPAQIFTPLCLDPLFAGFQFMDSEPFTFMDGVQFEF